MNMKHAVGVLCIAIICSWPGFAPEVWAFQNMLCFSEKTDRAFCSTSQEENTGNVKITCRVYQPAPDTSRTYTCTKAIRDWGQSSSPYAHTSTLWRCVNGGKEIFIFTADFDQDATRCDLICGKCSTKWRTHPSTHKP